MINVFIADDHQIVREGIKRLIDETENMHVSGEAVDGLELIEKLSAAEVCVLILDVSMPGPGFLENLRRINRDFPDINILVLSAHSEDQYAKRSFQAGAKGYLTKNHSPEELVNAVSKIAVGGRYISDTLAEKLAFSINEPSDGAPHDSLSQREYQILCSLGMGKSVGKIASDLSLSPKTVSTYRSRILEKMNLSSTPELIHYVLSHHLSE